MNIRIKSHLLAEIITLLITAFIMYLMLYQLPVPFPPKVRFQMYLFAVAAILGLFNVIYLFAQLCAQHCFKKAGQVVLWLVSFPLQWQLFVYISIPLMLVEIIMLCMNKEYIGKVKRSIKMESYDEEEFSIMNPEERTLYNDFVKGYRMRNIITILLLLFIILIYFYFSNIIQNEFILTVLLVVDFILIIFVPEITRSKYATTLTKKLYAKLTDECDSETYYRVSKSLCEEYPKNPVLVKNYIYSLLVNDNDYSELKRALKRFSNYQKEGFYILAYMELLPNEEQKEFFNQHYKEIKEEYAGMYRKTKKLSYPISAEMMRYRVNGEYEVESKLYDLIKIEEEENKLLRVLYTFNKAVCLKRIGRQRECEELLAYVVMEGNTLRVKYQAEEYLKEMHPEMLEQLEQEDEII